jgi:hypothetical protein
MKKFYVTVLRSFPRGIRTVNRIVPARNEREAIANCSYVDEVVSCERYDGQDLISPATACLNTRR